MSESERERERERDTEREIQIEREREREQRNIEAALTQAAGLRLPEGELSLIRLISEFGLNMANFGANTFGLFRFKHGYSV